MNNLSQSLLKILLCQWFTDLPENKDANIGVYERVSPFLYEYIWQGGEIDIIDHVVKPYQKFLLEYKDQV